MNGRFQQAAAYSESSSPVMKTKTNANARLFRPESTENFFLIY